MGKSSTLHCEVQLLDDQSTVLDLDVSLTYFVNEYFGSKMEDIPLHTISLNAAISLSANITNSLRCCVCYPSVVTSYKTELQNFAMLMKFVAICIWSHESFCFCTDVFPSNNLPGYWDSSFA